MHAIVESLCVLYLECQYSCLLLVVQGSTTHPAIHLTDFASHVEAEWCGTESLECNDLQKPLHDYIIIRLCFSIPFHGITAHQ